MNKKLLLIIILVVACILRFYKLGEVPVSIDWDEAAIGYNAYSLLETGKDEFGTPFPLAFRSFDDYKPPLYFYLAIPSVAVFGVNSFAVRFPSAFFGVLAVLGTYLLVQEFMQRNERIKEDKELYFYIPLVASFLLAISPWHVHFSRVAFEANTGVFFNIFGAYTFLKGLKQGKWLVVSSILFGLSLYEYHSERVFVPLLVVVCAVLYYRELIHQKTYAVLSAIIGACIVVPLVFILLNPSNLTRLTGTSSLSDQTGLLMRSVSKLEYYQQRGDIVGSFFANRRVTYVTVLLNGYLSHFNFNWLFITGDQERHRAPGMGLMYWWELPFLLIGMYAVGVSSFLVRRSKILLFSWFLISPIAASITTEVPHAIRTLVFLPTFQVFTTFGLAFFYIYVRKYFNGWVRNAIYGLLILVAAINLFYYLNLYYVHMDREHSKYWQYGYNQAVDFATQHYDKYDKIVVSTKLEQPHMFFLFFLKYPPETYLSEGGTYSGGFAEDRNSLDKYEFRRFTISEEQPVGKTLYIGTPNEIPGDGFYHIDYLDGTRAMEFYET
jgi:4-amino-4-deoxy-L-arabinose transferase-like glycosyltransferase